VNAVIAAPIDGRTAAESEPLLQQI